MTNKQYVIRACQIKGLDLIKPVRGNPGILAYDFTKKPSPCIIDATNWDDAKSQINKYFIQQSNT